MAEALQVPSPPADPRGKWFETIPITLRVIGVACCVVFVAALLGGFRRPSKGRGGETDTAEFQLKNLADAIDLYYLENHAIPAVLDELTQRSPRFGEPYIDKIPLDPWSHAFEYTVLDAKTRRFRLRSYGPDGRVANEDDLLWPKEEP